MSDDSSTDWAKRTARAWLKFSLTNLGMDECVRLLLEIRTLEVSTETHLDPAAPTPTPARDAWILVRGALKLTNDGQTLLTRAEKILAEAGVNVGQISSGLTPVEETSCLRIDLGLPS